jgi:hypothetical protein
VLAIIGRLDVRHQVLEAQVWYGTDWRPLIEELAGLAGDIDRLRGLMGAAWRVLVAEARS